MTTVITSDISRLVLHDSSFETIVRNNQDMELTFDWAKLNHFAEKNIAEQIIKGKTIMKLTGVVFEELRIFTNKVEYSVIPFPQDFSKNIYTISSNQIDEINKKIKICGLFRETDNSMFDWVEWSFGYNTCQISWSSCITSTEWLNGKSPDA